MIDAVQALQSPAFIAPSKHSSKQGKNMTELFVSLPTEHGNAKLQWDKAKFSAIIPTGPSTCVLHYDGVPVQVALSAEELSQRLENDPRVSLIGIRKKWIGQEHDGYNHIEVNYSFKRDFGDNREEYWLHQFLAVHVFLLPFFNPETKKLTTQVRIVGLAHAYEQNPFNGDGYYKNRSLYELNKVATGSFERVFTLPSQHKVTMDKIHDLVSRSMREASIANREVANWVLSDAKGQKRYWLTHGKESFILCDHFPSKYSYVLSAEYESRHADMNANVRDNFSYQIADLHAQSRIKAGEAQANATRAASGTVGNAILAGLAFVGASTQMAGHAARDGAIVGAQIRENIRQPRL